MTTDTATKILGARIRRREDPRLITGAGIYTDDLHLPGMAYMALLRSPYGHARIISIDTSAAKAVPGVVTVLTGKELAGKVGNVPTAWLLPDTKMPPHPPIASDEVHFSGDAVALVVAESRDAARDALDKIDGRVRAAAGSGQYGRGDQARRGSAARECAEQYRLPVEHRRRRCRCRAGERRGAHIAAPDQPAPDPHRDRAARRRWRSMPPAWPI